MDQHTGNGPAGGLGADGAAPELGAIAGQLAARARDAAYVAVGLGVLGIQRAQVARQRVAAQAVGADERLARVGSGVAAGAQQFGEWLEHTVTLVSSTLRPLEDQLPDQAREMAGKARAQLHAWREQARQVGRPGA